jgi:hypothetical protein
VFYVDTYRTFQVGYYRKPVAEVDIYYAQWGPEGGPFMASADTFPTIDGAIEYAKKSVDGYYEREAAHACEMAGGLWRKA